MNRHDRRKVLLLLALVTGALFVAGMVASILNRDATICPDGKPPAAQRAGIIGQVVYRCRDGRIVTMNN